MTTQGALKIIVERSADAQIIRTLLGATLSKPIRFFASQGLASLATVGRNVLFNEGGPVLLVMDSETLSPQLTAELRSINMVAMSGALNTAVQVPAIPSSLATEFKVFAFVPAIEAVFFEAPQILDRILGQKPPAEKVREGLLAPKQTLNDFLENAKTRRQYQALLADYDPYVQRALASGRQAQALVAMVESLLASSAAV